VKILTFNVCGIPSTLAPLARRTPEFCRRIEATDVDVANFQEVFTTAALRRIQAGLPSFRYVAWRRNVAGQPAGGLATFSRRPLRRVRYRSFAGIVPEQGSPRFRAKRALNSLLQGALTMELAGLGISVVNTHLTANKDGDWSSTNRYFAYQRAQIARLQAIIRPLKTDAVVLTGDFNVASNGPLYPCIVEGGWCDVFGDSTTVTFHLQFLPPGSTAHRIDYVLVRGRLHASDPATLFDAPVELADGSSMYVSDHVALVASLGSPQ
jgi:exonuclease III